MIDKSKLYKKLLQLNSKSSDWANIISNYIIMETPENAIDIVNEWIENDRLNLFGVYELYDNIYRTQNGTNDDYVLYFIMNLKKIKSFDSQNIGLRNFRIMNDINTRNSLSNECFNIKKILNVEEKRIRRKNIINDYSQTMFDAFINRCTYYSVIEEWDSDGLHQYYIPVETTIKNGDSYQVQIIHKLSPGTKTFCVQKQIVDKNYKIENIEPYSETKVKLIENNTIKTLKNGITIVSIKIKSSTGKIYEKKCMIHITNFINTAKEKKYYTKNPFKHYYTDWWTQYPYINLEKPKNYQEKNILL